MTTSLTKLEIYLSGVGAPHPFGQAGNAALTIDADKQASVVQEGRTGCSAGEMELRAGIHALEALIRPSEILLSSNSNYVWANARDYLPRWKTNGWRGAKGKRIENFQLWQKFSELLDCHIVHWQTASNSRAKTIKKRVKKLAEAGRHYVNVHREVIPAGVIPAN